MCFCEHLIWLFLFLWARHSICMLMIKSTAGVRLRWFNNWPPIVWTPYWGESVLHKALQERTMVPARGVRTGLSGFSAQKQFGFSGSSSRGNNGFWGREEGGELVIGHWNPNSAYYTAQLGSNHINITGLGFFILLLINTVNTEVVCDPKRFLVILVASWNLEFWSPQQFPSASRIKYCIQFN